MSKGLTIRGKVLRNAAVAAVVIAPVVAAGCGAGGGEICEKPHPVTGECLDKED